MLRLFKSAPQDELNHSLLKINGLLAQIDLSPYRHVQQLKELRAIFEYIQQQIFLQQTNTLRNFEKIKLKFLQRQKATYEAKVEIVDIIAVPANTNIYTTHDYFIIAVQYDSAELTDKQLSELKEKYEAIPFLIKHGDEISFYNLHDKKWKLTKLHKETFANFPFIMNLPKTHGNDTLTPEMYQEIYDRQAYTHVGTAPWGEFYPQRISREKNPAPPNETDESKLQRKFNYIKQLVDIAAKEHIKLHFIPEFAPSREQKKSPAMKPKPKLILNPKNLNTITRLITTEGALFSAETPMQPDHFARMLEFLCELGSAQPENLHVMLSLEVCTDAKPTAQVAKESKMPNLPAMQNIVALLECGKTPRLHLTAKSFHSRVDPRFKGYNNFNIPETIRNLRQAVSPQIEYVGTFICTTAGQTKFRVVTDICVDHLHASGYQATSLDIQRRISTSDIELPLYVSHTVVSNCIDVNDAKLTTKQATHADPDEKYSDTHTLLQQINKPAFGSTTFLYQQISRPVMPHLDFFHNMIRTHNKQVMQLHTLRQHYACTGFNFEADHKILRNIAQEIANHLQQFDDLISKEEKFKPPFRSLRKQLLDEEATPVQIAGYIKPLASLSKTTHRLAALVSEQVTPEKSYAAFVPREFVSLLSEQSHAVIEQFLKLSLDIDFVDEGHRSLLHAAIICHDQALVKFLIQNNANCYLEFDKKLAPMQLAIERSASPIVKILIDNGISINGKNSHGVPYLFQLEFTYMCSETPKFIDFLHEHKADFNLTDKTGNTVVHRLAALDADLTFTYINEHKKINLNHQNSDGDTAAHIAAKKRAVPFLIELVKSNVDLKIKNKTGKTVIDLVCANQACLNHSQFENLLPLLNEDDRCRIDEELLTLNGGTPLTNRLGRVILL